MAIIMAKSFCAKDVWHIDADKRWPNRSNSPRIQCKRNRQGSRAIPEELGGSAVQQITSMTTYAWTCRLRTCCSRGARKNFEEERSQKAAMTIKKNDKHPKGSHHTAGDQTNQAAALKTNNHRGTIALCCSKNTYTLQI